jgi:hypothetical protein
VLNFLYGEVAQRYLFGVKDCTQQSIGIGSLRSSANL